MTVKQTQHFSKFILKKKTPFLWLILLKLPDQLVCTAQTLFNLLTNCCEKFTIIFHIF